MSTLHTNQSQLDAAMDRELDAHQEALTKAIEAGHCLKCQYPLRVKLLEKALRFHCGDPECGWSATYPIRTIGTANDDYSRGWRDGVIEGMHSRTETIDWVMDRLSPVTEVVERIND